MSPKALRLVLAGGGASAVLAGLWLAWPPLALLLGGLLMLAIAGQRSRN